METYQEAYNSVLKLIQQKKNIILLGNGNNGKTYLITELKDKLKGQLKDDLEEYKIYYEIDDNINTSNNFIITINSIDQLHFIKNIKTYEIIDMNKINYTNNSN